MFDIDLKKKVSLIPYCENIQYSVLNFFAIKSVIIILRVFFQINGVHMRFRLYDLTKVFNLPVQSIICIYIANHEPYLADCI